MANIIEWQTDESEFSDSGPAGAEPQDQNVSKPKNDGTITQVKANENAVITKLADPLNDTNCVTAPRGRVADKRSSRVLMTWATAGKSHRF